MEVARGTCELNLRSPRRCCLEEEREDAALAAAAAVVLMWLLWLRNSAAAPSWCNSCPALASGQPRGKAPGGQVGNRLRQFTTTVKEKALRACAGALACVARAVLTSAPLLLSFLLGTRPEPA